MSNFLVNLAQRGAGLPATTIQAPPPLPFGPEIRKHRDGLAEELAPGNAASQAPLRARFSEESMEPPSEAPTHHAPSIQRLSGTEPSTPQHSSVGEPEATMRTSSLGPLPAPRQHVIPHAREAEVAPLEPPKRLNPAAPPFHSDREVISEIAVEHGHPTTAFAAQTIEPVGEPAPQVMSVAPGPPIIIREPGERQVVSPAELLAEPPRVGAQQRHETTLTAPTIRPALDESHTLLQFPQLTPAASPTPPAQLPIQVRIGRVEVHATTAPTPTPARPSPSAPLGFDSYYRVRNYRS
jgi:hypothetical protein